MCVCVYKTLRRLYATQLRGLKVIITCLHMGFGANVKFCKGYIIFMLKLVGVICIFMAVSIAAVKGPIDMSTAVLIRVDQMGTEDFKKIQDSVPSNNSELVFIWIKPGTYR